MAPPAGWRTARQVQSLSKDDEVFLQQDAPLGGSCAGRERTPERCLPADARLDAAVQPPLRAWGRPNLRGVHPVPRLRPGLLTWPVRGSFPLTDQRSRNPVPCVYTAGRRVVDGCGYRSTGNKSSSGVKPGGGSCCTRHGPQRNWRAAMVVALGLLTVILGLRGGGGGVAATAVAAVVVGAGALVWLIAVPGTLAGLPRSALLGIVALGTRAAGLLDLASSLWSDSAARAVTEFNRSSSTRRPSCSSLRSPTGGGRCGARPDLRGRLRPAGHRGVPRRSTPARRRDGCPHGGAGRVAAERTGCARPWRSSAWP